MDITTTFIVGIIGNVISILMYASPIGTFKKVVKHKSVEDYKGSPYVTTLLNTTLWTFYGLIKPGGLLLVTVNGVGSILQVICIILFLVYAPKHKRMHILKLVAILNVGFFGGVITVTLLLFHGNGRLLIAGVICAGITIGMYASPLSAMRIVMKTQSVEYMPFSLSCFQFINSGVWGAYSVLVKDIYIGVPNIIGIVLGSTQLILYAIYKKKTPSQKSKGEVEEMGSTHLLKRDLELQEVDDDGEPETKNKYLDKVRSLPNLSRQHSFQKLVRKGSLIPYQFHTGLTTEGDTIKY